MRGNAKPSRPLDSKHEGFFDSQLQLLRDFAGTGLSNATLRRFLLRARGDPNQAASLLLADPTFTVSAAHPRKDNACNIALSEGSAGPSALPVSSVDNAERCATPQPPTLPTVDQVRKAAWRSFYKKHYALAVNNCSPGRKDLIVSFITDLWRERGPHGRDELYAKARDDLICRARNLPSLAESNNKVELQNDSPRADAKREAKLVQLHSDTFIETNNSTADPGCEAGVAPNTDRVGDIDKQPCSSTEMGLRDTSSSQDACPNIETMSDVPQQSDEVTAKAVQKNSAPGQQESNPSPLKRLRPSPNLLSNYDRKPGIAVSDSSDLNVPCKTGWPKRFATRLLSCTLLVSGINIIKAGHVVDLEPSSPKRLAPKGGRKPTKSQAASSRQRKCQQAPTIVRFSRNGREIGRLPHDMARILAPVLLSGYVKAEARVIEAPSFARVMQEIVLEIALFISREAFSEGSTRSKDALTTTARTIPCRSKTRSSNLGKRTNLGDEGEDDGLDSDRIAVINFLERLQTCEPAVSSSTSASAAKPSQVNREGYIHPVDTELYYNTVHDIGGMQSHFSRPPALLCELRDYQKVGVSWMLARENGGEEPLDHLLHPLWKRMVFPDGTEFFANGTTGGLSLEAPRRNESVLKGGILADEMGLGKTIECIAVIVSDHASRLSENFGQKSNILQDESLGDIIATDSLRSSTNLRSTRNGSLVFDGSVENYYCESRAPANGRNDRSSNCISESNMIDVGVEVRNGECDMSSTRNRYTPLFGSECHARSSVVVPPVAHNADESIGSDGAGLSQQIRFDTRKECSDVQRENFPCPSNDRRRSEQESCAEDDMVPHCNGDGNDISKLHRGKNEDIVFRSARATQELNVPGMAGEELRTKVNAEEQDDARICRKSAREYSYAPLREGKKSPNAEKRYYESAGLLTGGTLLVVPMSMIQQWLDELDEHVESGFLRVKCHYGHNRGLETDISQRQADVVITSYGTLASESEEEGDDLSVASPGPLFRLEWRRIILDEAHTIKSRSTKWAKACFHLKGERRWCVTGTPIQNHVGDVFSLIRFLNIEPWSSWGFWNRVVTEKIESCDSALKIEAMNTVRDILSSTTLRRLKSTKGSDGKPLVQLSARHIQVVRLSQPKAELDFYEALHRKTRAKLDTFIAQGKVLNHYGSVLEMILRLRQACCHPWLVFAASQSDAESMKDRDKLYASFATAGSTRYVEKLLSDAEAGNSWDCPICLDAMDDAIALKKCGHAACRICLQRVLHYDGDRAVCPVCRVGIAGKSDFATLPRHSGSRFPMDLRKNWRSSAKLDAILNDIKEMDVNREASSNGVGKTVVMSQFTSFLDLIEIALERENVSFLRFDGSLTQRKRSQVLEAFALDDEMKEGTANVLLLSLKSGGVGLNLVSASRLCMADPSWNPQVDIQAMARIHRHGQTRDVVIKRYVIKDSVEERLLEVQQRKVDISEGALSSNSDEDKREARISEIRLLFSR